MRLPCARLVHATQQPGAVALVLWLLCSTARAAPPTDAAKTGARTLFEQGSAAFHRQDYERAIDLFNRAYEMDPVGALLLNIAQAHRLKRPPDCVAALRHYELYLAAEPRAPEREEVQRHVLSMRACIEAAAPPAATAVQPPPDPPPSHRGPIWLAGSGMAVALGGGGLYLVARRRYDQLARTCPCPDGLIDRWQTTTRASYGLMIGGGLLLSGALAWWSSDRQAAPGTERASLRFMLDRQGMGVAGSF